MRRDQRAHHPEAAARYDGAPSLRNHSRGHAVIASGGSGQITGDLPAYKLYVGKSTIEGTDHIVAITGPRCVVPYVTPTSGFSVFERIGPNSSPGCCCSLVNVLIPSAFTAPEPCHRNSEAIRDLRLICWADKTQLVLNPGCPYSACPEHQILPFRACILSSIVHDPPRILRPKNSCPMAISP